MRPFLNSISKAKAARLVRSLLDLFLDMEAATGQEVSYLNDEREESCLERRLASVKEVPACAVVVMCKGQLGGQRRT